MGHMRPPAVAGAFYPEDPVRLSQAVGLLLERAKAADTHAETPPCPPKALIVPHAGYVYSGATAARAYVRLLPWKSTIRRIVLLGPNHRVPLRGIAAPTCTEFATPLGTVPLDRAALAAVGDLPQVLFSDTPHAWEHALEVQLPFLQRVLDDFVLAPFVVGEVAPTAVADLLDRLWGGPETVLVVSSDLSHYHPDSEARARDAQTAARILARQNDLEGEAACGAMPLNGLLLAARRHDLAVHCLELCNSSRASGDTGRVVGYGAFALYPEVDHA
jgi:AmmeMemoRadiSam system protein B